MCVSVKERGCGSGCAVVHTDSFNCACFFFQKSVCSCSDEREVLTAVLRSFSSVLNVPKSPQSEPF